MHHCLKRTVNGLDKEASQKRADDRAETGVRAIGCGRCATCG